MRYSGYDYWRSTFIAVLASLTMIGALGCGEGEDQPDDGQQELSAPEIEPTYIRGNPTCGSEGFGDFEFKIEPVQSGTYSIDGTNDITITVYSTSAGQVFDWSSDLPIDAIVVKGGPNANLYDFTPNEYDSGTAYHSPTNARNGRYYGLSHISFCYDYNLIASKTADTSFKRTYQWDIEKTVSPASWELFDGDSGTSDYEVSVDKTGYTDSDWKVSGTITIENPSPHTATITDVDDTLSNSLSAMVDCGVTFPYDLPGGHTLECSYMMMLADASSLTNTVTVSTSGLIGGDESTAPVDFGSATITKVNDTINIDDTNGMSWMANDDAMFTYSVTLGCGEDEGTNDNVATIVETGQSSDASVSLDCYELDVQKSAFTSASRTFDWDIQKVVSNTDPLDTSGNSTPTLYVTLDEFGQGSGTVEYTVNVNKVGVTETDHLVNGDIVITNPNPSLAANLLDVTDIVDEIYAGTVLCPSYVVPAGGILTCTYEATLPDGTLRTNVATATQQNYDYGSDGSAVASGSTDYQGSAAVDFTNAFILEVFSSITVVDSLFGLSSLGVFSDNGAISYVWTYDCEFDQGLNPNVATILETGDNDDAMIELVCVEEPDEGCTPGYWKNHADSWMATGYAPSDKVNSAFPSADLYGLGNDTLMMALNYGGGPSVADKAKIMLRAAVAALLNASSPDVDYAYTTAEVINKVEAALQSGMASQILSVANDLDFENNAGCPLN